MRKALLFTLLAGLLTFGFTAAAQEDLDAEYESDLITFAYPEDWAICDDCFEDEFTLILGTSQDAIDAELAEESVDEGELIVYITADIEAALEFYDALQDDFDDITPEEIEETYFMPEGYDYGRLRTNDDETMAWVEWEQLEDAQHDGLDIVLQLDDKFVFVGGEAASGTMGDFEDTIFAIAESVSLPDDSRTENRGEPNVYEDEIITFEYPEDWVDCGCPPEDIVVIVGNNPDVIENLEAMDDGDIQVIIAKDAEEFVELLNEDARWDDDLSLAEALDEYLTFDGSGVEVGDIEELDFDGREAAARRTSNEDTDFEQLMILVQVDRRRVALVFAITRVGTMDDFEEDVYTLAGTIESVD